MGTITGQNILDRGRDKANDEGATKRWSDAKALFYINDGQREIVNQLPKAWAVRSIATPSAGTRQTVSGMSLTGGLSIIDVPRNFSADGTTPGSPITRRERAYFDEYLPTWHSASAAEAEHWFYDDRDPKSFFLYPAPTGKVEVIYSAVPTDLSSLASTITLDDIYANALQFFLLFSFYSKDATYNRSSGLAQGYWTLFLQSLGLRENAIRGNTVQGAAKATGVSP